MKTAKFTIFVVDDNSIALQTLKRELHEKINCRVHAFSSAEDCLHRLEDGVPDLIIADYYLDPLNERRMNGDQMLAHVKRLHPDIPVIMYSSQNTVEIVLRLMKLGAVDFVPKEKNFIKTISDITHRQVQRLQHDSEMKYMARVLVFLLMLFIVFIFVMSIYKSELLPYIIFGGPMLILGWAFFVNRKSNPKVQSEDVG